MSDVGIQNHRFVDVGQHMAHDGIDTVTPSQSGADKAHIAGLYPVLGLLKSLQREAAVLSRRKRMGSATSESLTVLRMLS